MEAENFNTPRKAVEIIERGKGATTAGENGCLTAWRTRSGILRAELGRFLQIVEAERFDDYKALAAWLKPRLKEIRHPNAKAAQQRKALEASMKAGHVGLWERQS